MASWSPKTYAAVPDSILDPHARLVREREESAAWEDEHRYDHDEHDPPEEEA